MFLKKTYNYYICKLKLEMLIEVFFNGILYGVQSITVRRLGVGVLEQLQKIKLKRKLLFLSDCQSHSCN